MPKLNKLYFSALLAIFTACELSPEASTTEVSGNVVDIETKQPVADVKLDLTVAESIDQDRRLQNSVFYNTTSDAHGAYKFIFYDEPNDEQQIYRITPQKEGYLEVANTNLIATQLSEGKQNRADVMLVRGSYLDLTVKQLPESGVTKTIEIRATHSSDVPDLKGTGYVSQYIVLNASKTDTLLNYGYHFKKSPTVTLHWKVRSNGTSMTEQTHEAIVDLKEYDTVGYEINY